MTSILRFLAILILLAMASVALLEYSSTFWPKTVGVMQRGSAVRRDSSILGGRSEAAYTYEVGGKNYTGQRVGFDPSSREVPVLGVKDPRPPREGDEVHVYYLPFLPSFSLLVPGAPKSLIWWCATGVLVSILLFTMAQAARQPVF